MEEKKKKKFGMPHTYVILFSVIILMTVCTYLIPAGQYERIEDPSTGKMVVDASSYTVVEQSPVSLFDFFKAVPSGMNAASSIIFFIFVVGGAFNVIMSTGAIEAGIGRDYLILLSVVGGLAIIVYGVFQYGWYVTEISAVFFAMGPFSAALSQASAPAAWLRNSWQAQRASYSAPW